MAIRADSYSSTGEVLAFTRHLLSGELRFNSSTQPRAVEIEKFIDRASAHLNVALADAGMAAPVTNSTAKLMMDDWVTARATEYVELTQRGSGYSDAENSRYVGFRNMAKAAKAFIAENRLGLIRLGISESHGKAEGLQFTGQTAQADRADQDDNSLEQPLFRRRLFGDNSVNQYDANDHEEDD